MRRVDSDRLCGRVRLLNHKHPTLEASMPVVGPAAIRTDLGVIFVSLELSQSKRLITSLSRSGSENMSKHAVAAGDVAGMLGRFAELKRKARTRTGRCFPIIVVRRLGSTASGSIGCWRPKGSKAMSSIRPRLQSRAVCGGRRPTGSTAKRWFAHCSLISGASRGCVRWSGCLSDIRGQSMFKTRPPAM